MKSSFDCMKRFLRFAVFGLAALLIAGPLAHGQATAINTIPSGVWWAPVVGDAYTFTCPKKGFFYIFVDTLQDNAGGTSNLMLAMEVHDGQGNPVTFTIDDSLCSFASVCGYDCPDTLVYVPCGKGNPHTISIYSWPSDVSNSNTGVACNGGGGYELYLETVNKKGKMVNPKLGGRGNNKLGKGAIKHGFSKSGPALDNEAVPSSVLGVVAPMNQGGETVTRESLSVPDPRLMKEAQE